MTDTDRRKVWFSETLALGLGASLVDWGEPDEDGFYTPALTRPAAPAEGLVTEQEAEDMCRRAVALERQRCADLLARAVPAPAEGLGDALERIARSRKSVNGLCVMCGAMDSQHHRPGCVHAIAIAALAEWDKAGIYLDPPSIAALRAYVAQPTAPAEGLCMARSGEPCSDPVNHHQPAAPAEGLPFIPHPDMPHEYHAVCRICGEPGYINLTLVAGDEAVQVVKRDDR